MKERLLGSLTLGAIAGAIVAVYSGTKNHAALAAEAAKNHSSVLASLLSGFVAITLVVGLIVFVAITVLGSGRRTRQARPDPAR